MYHNLYPVIDKRPRAPFPPLTLRHHVFPHILGFPTRVCISHPILRRVDRSIDSRHPPLTLCPVHSLAVDCTLAFSVAVCCRKR